MDMIEESRSAHKGFVKHASLAGCGSIRSRSHMTAGVECQGSPLKETCTGAFVA
jgi:hypothetical protein